MVFARVLVTGALAALAAGWAVTAATAAAASDAGYGTTMHAHARGAVTTHAATHIAAHQDGRTAAMAVRDALAAAPEGTGRLVVVPRLRRTAETLNGLLAGMDRAQLLLGADPVDQLMGLLGFSRHVDRFGSVVGAWVPPAEVVAAGGVAEADDVDVVVLVPSDDPAAFLTVNFTPTDEAGVYRDAGGGLVHARVVGRHVALGRRAFARTYVPMGEAGAAAVERAWGDPGAAMVRGDDVLLVGLPLGMAHTTAPLLSELDALAAGGGGGAGGAAATIGPTAAILRAVLAPAARALEPGTGPLATEAAAVLQSFRFDPLGIVHRAVVRWTPAAGGDAAGEPGRASDRRARPRVLAGIPDPPGMIRLGWDRSSPAATRSLDRLLDAGGIQWSPLLGQATHVAMTLKDRPPAPGRGLLNGLRVRALLGPAAPEAASDATGASPSSADWLTIPGWQFVAMPTSDDAAAADGTTVGVWRQQRDRTAPGSPGGIFASMLVGGPAGLQGASALTSQGTAAGSAAPTRVRFAVDTTLDAARAVAGDDGRWPADDAAPLEADPAVDLMRTMAAAPSVLELYVDVAALTQWLAGAAEAVPALGIQVDPIQDWLPPVGVLVGADAARVDATTIVPAQVAAALFDAVGMDLLAALTRATGGPDQPGAGPGAEAGADDGR